MGWSATSRLIYISGTSSQHTLSGSRLTPRQHTHKGTRSRFAPKPRNLRQRWQTPHPNRRPHHLARLAIGRQASVVTRRAPLSQHHTSPLLASARKSSDSATTTLIPTRIPKTKLMSLGHVTTNRVVIQLHFVIRQTRYPTTETKACISGTDAGSAWGGLCVWGKQPELYSKTDRQIEPFGATICLLLYLSDFMVYNVPCLLS